MAVYGDELLEGHVTLLALPGVVLDLARHGLDRLHEIVEVILIDQALANQRVEQADSDEARPGQMRESWSPDAANVFEQPVGTAQSG